MQGVIILAAFTSRSIAYVQAMIEVGIQPEKTFLFGREHGNAPGQTSLDSIKIKNSLDIFYPDYSISLLETLNKSNWNYEKLDIDHISDKKFHNLINNLKPNLVIYSGYGSQIVPKSLLEIGTPFLHLHSGKLPNYRGSTTLYYSWLIEQSCAVSAILLDEGIDTGNIVGKKTFPPPPNGIDPDHIYDPSIRADLLVEVLKEFSTRGKFNNLTKQDNKGKTYYVIHPVLKHLARLQNQ